ncbi:hypothetical protein F5884DRAFT_865824 [Xylogone sp. PMI_703]|nr:hypothetical protein F5884DRAFT_865824 [Xylogone sp. PMI_703]
MATDARSQKGCWTCRVRKRKCDERRPICSECSNLAIECHGQGERPEWMDRGAKQKAQAEKIKQRIRELKRQKHVNQINSQRDSTMNSARRNTEPGTRPPSIPMTSPVASNQPIVGQNGSISSPSTSSPPAGNNQFNITSQNYSTVSDLFGPGVALTEFQPFLVDDIGSLFPYSHMLEDDSVPLDGTHLLLTDIELSVPLNSSDMDISTETKLPARRCSLEIDSIEDAMLLAYYMNEVFSWQFRFCSFHSPDFNQGHILWLVSNSQSLYNAILTLSRTHRSLEKGLKEPSFGLNGGEYTHQYGLTIKELQRELQDSKSYDNGCIVACIIMFMYSTLLQNSNEIDWLVHLQAGTSIVAVWIDQIFEPSTGLLSTRELALKVHVTKERLEKQISLNLEEMNKFRKEGLESHDGESTEFQNLEFEISVITHIFACSVAILLEMIMSGPFPQLPEMKKEVDRALESYAYISDPELLHSLRWPLCVAGSVAEPDQHGIFRCLLSSPKVVRVSAFREVTKLLERCWEISQDVRTAHDSFDFTEARKYISSNILIV